MIIQIIDVMNKSYMEKYALFLYDDYEACGGWTIYI